MVLPGRPSFYVGAHFRGPPRNPRYQPKQSLLLTWRVVLWAYAVESAVATSGFAVGRERDHRDEVLAYALATQCPVLTKAIGLRGTEIGSFRTCMRCPVLRSAMLLCGRYAMSGTEIGYAATRSRRWPLMIDPQTQACVLPGQRLFGMGLRVSA
eukprot:2821850-Rhodomonas_salina.1